MVHLSLKSSHGLILCGTETKKRHDMAQVACLPSCLFQMNVDRHSETLESLNNECRGRKVLANLIFYKGALSVCLFVFCQGGKSKEREEPKFLHPLRAISNIVGSVIGGCDCIFFFDIGSVPPSEGLSIFLVFSFDS